MSHEVGATIVGDDLLTVVANGNQLPELKRVQAMLTEFNLHSSRLEPIGTAGQYELVARIVTLQLNAQTILQRVYMIMGWENPQA